jgi:hypothetical protein
VAGLVSSLEATATQLERLVRGLEPDRLENCDVLRALEAVARLSKLAEAGRTVLARVVEARGLHARSGHLSAAHLLAATAGTSVGEAAATIETSLRLADQAELAAAFRSGELSLQQATVISEASEHDPAAERALIELSQRESLRTIKAKARAVKAAAEEDRLGRYERQRAASCFRHGLDQRDGMVWGHFRLPPDEGAAVVNRIEHECDRVFRRAHKEGRRDSHDRYAAEALVAVVTGAAGSPTSRGAEVVTVVSADALRRGRLEGDELCTIPGFGDVPLEVPRRMLDDNAFLTAVLYDGERVQLVKRFGRYRSAAVRSALVAEAMLAHGQVVCSERGCDRTDIEWDHTVPVADGGANDVCNQQPLCRGHHRRKTIRENQARARRRTGRGGTAERSTGGGPAP